MDRAVAAARTRLARRFPVMSVLRSVRIFLRHQVSGLRWDWYLAVVSVGAELSEAGLRGFAAMSRPAQPPRIMREPGPKQRKQLCPGKFSALSHVFDPQLLCRFVDFSVR